MEDNTLQSVEQGEKVESGRGESSSSSSKRSFIEEDAGDTVKYQRRNRHFDCLIGKGRKGSVIQETQDGRQPVTM